MPHTCKQHFSAGMAFIVVLAALLQLGSTQNTTTPETTTTTTTATPTTTTTTAAPPTTTTPAPSPPGNPERGTYNLVNDSGAPCLITHMGLQLNVTFLGKESKMMQDVMNLNPNQTKHMGSCGANTATLTLMADGTNLTFSFSLNTTSRRYHLSSLALSAAWPDMPVPLEATNSSLDYLRGTLGRSYMCREEQTLAVTQNFSLNTYQLQVQPFGVSSEQFAEAEVCALDEDNMLIPIIVGAALSGLVLIVLMAYLIGRKRSHAGYQTI